MRVVVPYTGTIDPRVLDALTIEEDCACVDVTGSERAYYDLLSSLWRDGEAFCIVEHDVIVNPDSLQELADCPEDWCSFPYDYAEWGLTHGLGCVKFSADLIARNPTAMIRVGVLSDAKHAKRHWCRLDARLQGVILPSSGETLHRHETPVTHLGRGCAHGCTAA